MSKKPVVFIHGNGDSSLSWSVQMNRFKAAGYDSLHAIDLKPAENASCLLYAKQIKSFVEEVIEKTKSKQVDIIGHSLGVTSIRAFLKIESGAGLIDHAVLIAGANHGLPAADGARLADPEGKIYAQGVELHTANPPFLSQLNQPEECYGNVKYMCIYGPQDDFYTFYEDSPTLKGADNRMIEGLGHFGLRDSEDTFKLALAFFEGKADKLDIGKKSMVLPTQPYGEYEMLAGPFKGARWNFKKDKTYSYSFAESVESGTFTFDENKSPQWINLTCTKSNSGKTGEISGIYKISATGFQMRIALSEPGGARPESISMLPAYDKIVEYVKPEKLIGKWDGIDLGFMASAGYQSLKLSVDSSSNFELSGKNTMVPDAECVVTGKITFSDKVEPNQINFYVEQSNNQFYTAGDMLPGIIRFGNGTIETRFGSFIFGLPRSPAFDLPAKLKKV